METIKYKDVKPSKEALVEVNRILSKDFIEKLVQNHGVFPRESYDEVIRDLDIFIKLNHQLVQIYTVLEGTVDKKRILDLGCGAYGNRTVESTWDTARRYEPWLCRALMELGANPIGIDIGSLNREKFEHYSINLLEPDALKFLETSSIDVANASMLFDSPTLEDMTRIESEKLKKLLIPQLERIVKPDGHFLVY